MRDDTFGAEFDRTVTTLVRLSTEWFREQQEPEIALRFSRYVDESRSGRLQHYYARLLDGSMECLMGVLPLLVSRLSSDLRAVVQIPSGRLRPLLSMIIYWLIQHHAGKVDGLPGEAERRSIIANLLGK